MSPTNAEKTAKDAGVFERQRKLLQLLDALGGSAGNLDFQKLLFLYCQELSSGAPYDFVPYKSEPSRSRRMRIAASSSSAGYL